MFSHPTVEIKNGVIRCTSHIVYRMTQMDDGNTQVEMGGHINFGGMIPRPIVNGYIIPNFSRVVAHQQTFFMNSTQLEDLTKMDGKLLGEVRNCESYSRIKNTLN